jgi:myosin heavy subunit
MIVPGSVCLAYHPEHAWVPGVVDHFDGKLGNVTVSFPKKESITKLKEQDIFVCDEQAMSEDVNDLLNLSVLHDGTLLACLRDRYARDVVYTNIGAIVVALNPFNFKIPWYMDDKMQSYLQEGETIQNNLPHSWAVAHNTYYEMRADFGNQCILVSGESGAGKTEASKIVMKYLGAISAMLAPTIELKEAGMSVGTKMMNSNPILEAFGNAKTVRNDNSSRFGKLMRIKFNEAGVLTGADITKYLLEKSRILSAAPDERIYHSFYLLLKGKDRERLGLDPMKDYKPPNSGGCTDIPGMDDTEDYQIVLDAMLTCGVKNDEREAIWRTLGGILTLQRIDFFDKEGSDQCYLPEASLKEVRTACGYLSVDPQSLHKELTTTTLTIQKQEVVRELNRVKAYDARDSLCKALYDNVFTWLVTTINKTIDTTDVASWIALLDIFGFEDFKINSFEQVCINLTNETLQGHYNSFIFVRDMEECRAEGIDTTEIEFPDNKPCIDMVSAKGGILSILDEECMLGKATDLTFLDKICEKFGKNPFFERPRLAKVPSFRIHHYAGSVTYEVDNFLDKNRDTLKDALKLMIRASKDPFVAELLPAPVEGSRFTVGGFFKNQLKDLMDLINSTNPHWIRCIKPHPAKKPRMFHGVQTLTQLRSSGVLGTVQIRKAGYPIRLKVDDFGRRYRVLCVMVKDVDPKNLHAVAGAVLKLAEFPSRLGQVGKTRVFLKSEAYQKLEMMKKQKLQIFADTAIAGAHLAIARRRTALFLRQSYAVKLQAVLRARQSQTVYQVKHYDSRKDVIIAQVRLLLKMQKEEEYKRQELAGQYTQLLEGLKVMERENLAKLEALWWATKPERDAQMLVDLEKKEEQLRVALERELVEAVKAFMIDMEEDRLDSIACQEEREEEERQGELQRLREEEDRAREDERRRVEEERIENEKRKEEQRRIALHYWSKHKQQAAEEKRRREQEEAQKTRWMKECSVSTRQALQLMREEPHLQARERLNYPPTRFNLSNRFGGSSLDMISGARPISPTPSNGLSPKPKELINDALSNDASNDGSPSRRDEPHGIGGLNPMLVNPAEEKQRLAGQRLYPDRLGSLAMVQRLRRLQGVRDTNVLRTPALRSDDLRNPMNPNSPDWAPPNGDMIVLPDGTQISVADCDLPTADAAGGRRQRRQRTPKGAS